MSRLVTVEVLENALGVGILGLVACSGPAPRCAADQADDHDATAIAGGELSHRVPELRREPRRASSASPSTDARTHRGVVRPARRVRGPAAPVRRRRVARAAHAGDHRPGYAELYRAGGLADPTELGQAMRRTEQEAIRMGDARRGPAAAGPPRPGPAARAGRPVDLGRRSRWTRSPTPGPSRPDRPIDGRRRRPASWSSATRAACGRWWPTWSATRWCTRRRRPPVEVRAFADERRAELEVEDHGGGMAPDVADHAFERFYRADPSRSRHEGGSGLGLSIVRAIVEAHAGAVSLRSAVAGHHRAGAAAPCSSVKGPAPLTARSQLRSR